MTLFGVGCSSGPTPVVLALYAVVIVCQPDQPVGFGYSTLGAKPRPKRFPKAAARQYVRNHSATANKSTHRRPGPRRMSGYRNGSRSKTAGFEVDSAFPKWRATADEDGQYSFAVTLCGSLRHAAVAENATAYDYALCFNAILWITTVAIRALQIRCRLRIGENVTSLTVSCGLHSGAPAAWETARRPAMTADSRDRCVVMVAASFQELAEPAAAGVFTRITANTSNAA
jgi:hypothetical protein